jgi:hypothetical protein
MRFGIESRLVQARLALGLSDILVGSQRTLQPY